MLNQQKEFVEYCRAHDISFTEAYAPLRARRDVPAILDVANKVYSCSAFHTNRVLKLFRVVQRAAGSSAHLLAYSAGTSRLAGCKV